MRKKMIAIAVLACASLSVAAAPAVGASNKKSTQVLVCKDVKKSNNKGTVIGAVGGGLLGNVVAGHGNKTAGTVIGAGVGAVAGHEVARHNNEKKPNQECHYEYR
ncbi:MAG: glycine zipper 2TM domain-containing protein [Phenylobacterium sp.]